MTERLAEAFLETLLENNWLDNNTKNYARMKINEIDLKIGYPDFILNSTELTEEYSDVKIHPNYFFENILSILRHLTRVQQNKLGTTVNRTFMSTPPTVVNAYYSRNKNQISNQQCLISILKDFQRDCFQCFQLECFNRRSTIVIFRKR